MFTNQSSLGRKAAIPSPRWSLPSLDPAKEGCQWFCFLALNIIPEGISAETFMPHGQHVIIRIYI